VTEASAIDLLEGPRIGLVFIGSNCRFTPFRHDPRDKLRNASSGGLGKGTAMSGFEKFSPLPLCRPHGAATTKFSLSYAVNEVRRTDEQVQVEGPILAVFKGSKAVENQRLVWSLAGTKLFMEEQAVTAQTFGLAL
jgi:hypothetical protein